jgi:hypothetical protein
MKILVEHDLEGTAASALERASPEVRASLRALLANAREIDAADVAEFLELPADDLLGAIERCCNARVLAGDSHDNIRRMIEDTAAFFADCGSAIDETWLVSRFTPKERVPPPPDASRQDLMVHLMDDPYTATVAHRLFGIEGVIPTEAFLRELVALDLRAEHEPHVARVVATLGTVADAHREIIEPLRRVLALARH